MEAVDQRLATHVDDLKKIRAELDAERMELERSYHEQKNALDAHIKKITGAISALEPPAPKRKKAQPGHVGEPRANGTATGLGITVEACEPVVTEILRRREENPEDRFIQKDIYTAIGMDQAKCSAAFRYLREIEFLRAAGKTSTRADMWAVMDPTAYERMRANPEGNKEVHLRVAA